MKSATELKVRPIVRGCGSPYDKISWLICHILRPLMECVPAHFKNTHSFLSKLQQAPADQLKNLTINLLKWVNSNGLALNLKKTKYMIFSKTRNTELPQPLTIADKLIERKYEARFLGVIMDESLNWSRHVKTVQAKMARYVGIMYKIKKYLPLNARLQIFHSFVQSHANYCSLVWGFSCKHNIELLFRKQKIGMRAVIPGFINYKYKDGKIPGHTKAYFSEYGILTIHNMIVFNTLNFMHKVKNYPSLLPDLVLKTIADDSPIPGSTHESCQLWLKLYD